MKEFLALSATLLIVVAYIPYIRDILKEKTRPHIYTWLVSGSVTFIAAGVQFSDGAGWGAAPTFFAALAGLLVFALSLRYKRASITKSDTFFFVMALIATGLWLIADQPLLSVIIVTLIEFLAFIPTYRKSWKNPEQETASMYYMNAIRFTIAALAVQNYSLVTVLYPVGAALTDIAFFLFLILRRRALANNSQPELRTIDATEAA